MNIMMLSDVTGYVATAYAGALLLVVSLLLVSVLQYRKAQKEYILLQNALQT